MNPDTHVDSYYAASQRGAVDFPALCEEIATDVCIIGGGYSGLSAALELAVRGFEVTLLEANRVGWGASGRNGGQIVSGFSTGLDKIAHWVGMADTKRLWALAEEAKELLRRRVADYHIDCDLKRGYLFAAVKDRQLEELRSERDFCATELGYHQYHLLDRSQTRDEVDTNIYCGGLLDNGGGHLHPLNYALGLARTAAELGVSIYEQSCAIRIRQQPKPTVETDRGTVRAKYLVLCGNAYLGELVPDLRRKIMPVGTYMIATEPLTADVAARLIPNDIAVADVNFVLDYYRLSADRRMLFGGKVSYTTMPPPGLEKAMQRSMLRVFPQMGDVQIEYVWGGNVAITAERTPHIGRLKDDVYFAQGFSGHGVALTGIAGKVIAEAVAGTADRMDLFERLPHRSFVGGRFMRMPLLGLAMLYFRLRDLL